MSKFADSADTEGKCKSGHKFADIVYERSIHLAYTGKRSVNEDELAEVMAEEAAAADGSVDKRDPYAFGLGKKVRLLNGSWSSCSPRVLKRDM